MRFFELNSDQRQADIIESFRDIAGWEGKYKKIIDLGKQLEPIPETLKTENLKVKGCQSQVWIHASLDDNKKIMFRGDSDALVVKGLVALVLQIYSGLSADEVMATEPIFISEIGLQSHLSPSRTNGLAAMIKQIKYYAAAFKALGA